jgi:NAD(P)H-dependent FMN reductase
MYTLIAGTNRLDSNSAKIGQAYQKMLHKQGIQADLHTLSGLDLNHRSESFIEFETRVLIPTQKFILLMPEYNGSYPGVFKTMIDLCAIKECWSGKKALLTGISTGRGGNIRGLEHLTGSLNYMNVFVHPNRLPISLVHQLIDEHTVLYDEKTIIAIEQQLNEFVKF